MSSPTRSRTVLSYSTLFRRCAATRPGLIGPATPGGSWPAPPRGSLMTPVQPPGDSAIARIVRDSDIDSDGCRLHEGKRERCAAPRGVGDDEPARRVSITVFPEW